MPRNFWAVINSVYHTIRAALWALLIAGAVFLLLQIPEMHMTEKQLEDTYGHHHPDHLLGPRDAFDRPPQLRHRKPATEREQTPSSVTKIADRSR